MLFGVAMFPTDYAVGPAELARLVEERGFESLWFPEHTHIPVDRATPFPGGGELPRQYLHTYDPFVALAVAAAATERLRLATGICLVVERDPITTAKEVASLDRLSGGRFVFGVGAGWNGEEMGNHGTDPGRRFGVMLDRVLRFGDEWMPNRVPLADLPGRIAELRRRGLDAGRGRIPVGYFGAPPEREAVERHAEAGVDRCVFIVPPEGEDEVRRRLDGLAELAAACSSL